MINAFAAPLIAIAVITILAHAQRRREEVQTMEPPEHGEMHHLEGNIREIRAMSPIDAIDRLIDRSRPLVDQRR